MAAHLPKRLVTEKKAINALKKKNAAAAKKKATARATQAPRVKRGRK